VNGSVGEGVGKVGEGFVFLFCRAEENRVRCAAAAAGGRDEICAPVPAHEAFAYDLGGEGEV
jgi:hypothetical protein